MKQINFSDMDAEEQRQFQENWRNKGRGAATSSQSLEDTLLQYQLDTETNPTMSEAKKYFLQGWNEIRHGHS